MPHVCPEATETLMVNCPTQQPLSPCVAERPGPPAHPDFALSSAAPSPVPLLGPGAALLRTGAEELQCWLPRGTQMGPAVPVSQRDLAAMLAVRHRRCWNSLALT